jgi:hypothetical protein
MKVIFIFILIPLLGGCSSENNNHFNDLSNFIKPNYSHYQAIFNCELLPDKNLNSVEKFIPLFVDNLNIAREKGDEVVFLFPIQNENGSISKFKILLNHSEEFMANEMNDTLSGLSFEEIAECDKENTIYGRLSLIESTLPKSPSVIEMMECKYSDDFSYATMKLVFEEFIDALARVHHNISVVYSENLKENTNFRWFNIYESMESRTIFVKRWQDLSVSNKIQTLLLEQSNCGAAKLYNSYKVA